MYRILKYTFTVAIFLSLSGCATTETYTTVTPTVVTSSGIDYRGPKQLVALGKFINASTYMRGLFVDDKTDRVGGQARTILESHLNQSNHFRVFNRDNLSNIKQEAIYNNRSTNVQGSRFIITGSVSEFGRKNVGDVQLFGLAGKGKSQIAYCKVILNVIDVYTSEVVFTSAGAGEYALNSREVVGFGSTSGYDPTLTGKVLDLGIRESVDNLALGLRKGQWGE